MFEGVRSIAVPLTIGIGQGMVNKGNISASLLIAGTFATFSCRSKRKWSSGIELPTYKTCLHCFSVQATTAVEECDATVA